LLTELDAVFTEQRRCGELDAGVEGLVIWIDCECGALWRRGRIWMTMPASLDLDAATVPVMVGRSQGLGLSRR
jgi:hypothetical protein